MIMSEDEAGAQPSTSNVKLAVDPSSEHHFWTHPVCRWVRVCVERRAEDGNWTPRRGDETPKDGDHAGDRDWRRTITYLELSDGVLLNALLLYIDPRPTNQKVTPCDSSDISGRIKNLKVLLKNMQSFYKEVLRQLIVMPLPDLLAIARQPYPEGSGEEMKKVLLLLLGCAVQSDKREEFVERIKQLELSLQQSIVEQIRMITNNSECVLNVQALELDPDDQATTTVLHQLQRVVKERDAYAQTLLELHQEQESDSSSGGSLVCNGDVCARKLPESLQHDTARCLSPSSSDKTHSAVELASVKAEMRKLRNELDEKSVHLADVRDELALKDEELSRAQQERIELLRQARTAKDYRDELDCLQHKVSKLDKLEAENIKLKERLPEFEFLKSRTEELRQENHILLETRRVLEDQVENWKRKVQTQNDTELKLAECQRSVSQLQADLRLERETHADLADEKTRLEKECREQIEKRQLTEKELDAIRSNPATSDSGTEFGSIHDQLQSSDRSAILRLELESQKLKAQLEQQSGTEADVSASILRKELETVNNENDNLRMDKETLTKQLRTTRSELENRVNEIERDNGRLCQELETAKRKHEEQNEQRTTEANAEYQRQLDASSAQLAASEALVTDLRQASLLVDAECIRLRARTRDADTRLLQAQEETFALETRAGAAERDRRTTLADNAALKEKLDHADTELEKSRSQLIEWERDQKRLVHLQERLDDSVRQCAERDAECHRLTTQTEVDAKRAERLLAETERERTRSAQLLAKMHAVCAVMKVCDENDENIDNAIVEAWQENEQEVESLRLCVKQKGDQLQLITDELEACKKELHLANSNQTASADTSVRVRELETETRNAKDQVGIVQEKLRRLQADMQAKESQLLAARRKLAELNYLATTNASLQSDVTKLQTTLRHSELQEDLLRSDNEELQRQCATADRHNGALRGDTERLHDAHSRLLTDHEQLQKLHEQLSRDYESVKCEVDGLKGKQRQLRGASMDAVLLRQQSDKDRRALEDLKALLSDERSQKDREFKAFALLQNEHADLKHGHAALRGQMEALVKEFDTVAHHYRRVKSEHQNCHLIVTQLQNQIAELQEQLVRRDLEMSKMGHKCEMLTQLNGTLEEESRNLMRQMDLLIGQNQDLLTRAMMDKDQYHAEEKELQERLNSLRRQKEKLEEKIMEQYKTMDNCHGGAKKPPKQTFVKRAAKALMPKAPNRKASKDASPPSANGRTPPPTSNGGEDTSSAQSAEFDDAHVDYTPPMTANGSGTPSPPFANDATRLLSAYHRQHQRSAVADSDQRPRDSSLDTNGETRRCSAPPYHQRSSSTDEVERVTPEDQRRSAVITNNGMPQNVARRESLPPHLHYSTTNGGSPDGGHSHPSYHNGPIEGGQRGTPLTNGGAPPHYQKPQFGGHGFGAQLTNGDGISLNGSERAVDVMPHHTHIPLPLRAGSGIHQPTNHLTGNDVQSPTIDSTTSAGRPLSQPPPPPLTNGHRTPPAIGHGPFLASSTATNDPRQLYSNGSPIAHHRQTSSPAVNGSSSLSPDDIAATGSPSAPSNGYAQSPGKPPLSPRSRSVNAAQGANGVAALLPPKGPGRPPNVPPPRQSRSNSSQRRPPPPPYPSAEKPKALPSAAPQAQPPLVNQLSRGGPHRHSLQYGRGGRPPPPPYPGGVPSSPPGRTPPIKINGQIIGRAGAQTPPSRVPVIHNHHHQRHVSNNERTNNGVIGEDELIYANAVDVLHFDPPAGTSTPKSADSGVALHRPQRPPGFEDRLPHGVATCPSDATAIYQNLAKFPQSVPEYHQHPRHHRDDDSDNLRAVCENAHSGRKRDSLYENLEELNGPGANNANVNGRIAKPTTSASLASETLNSTLQEDAEMETSGDGVAGERQNSSTVWYEYGCV